MLLTLRESAARLGLAPDTLRAQVHRGRFTAQKVGRDWLVDEGEVERYARETRRRAPTPVRRGIGSDSSRAP
jgi:excisionase family DNA binding protein